MITVSEREALIFIAQLERKKSQPNLLAHYCIVSVCVPWCSHSRRSTWNREILFHSIWLAPNGEFLSGITVSVSPALSPLALFASNRNKSAVSNDRIFFFNTLKYFFMCACPSAPFTIQLSGNKTNPVSKLKSCPYQISFNQHSYELIFLDYYKHSGHSHTNMWKENLTIGTPKNNMKLMKSLMAN